MMYLNKCLFILAFFFSNFLGLFAQQKKYEEPKGLRFTDVFPNVDEKGQVNAIDTGRVDLFFYKDMIAYKLPMMSIDTPSKINYIVVVRNKDSVYGYCIYNHFDSGVFRNKWCEAIQFIKNYCSLYSIYLEDLFDKGDAQLVDSVKQNDMYINKKYKVYTKSDHYYVADVVLSYSPTFSGIHYSLSKRLDLISLEGGACSLKLYKVLVQLKPYTINGISYSARQLQYWLEELNGFDSAEILRYFEIYKTAVRAKVSE